MKRIFCADDDPGLQEVFPLIFTRAGYDVTMFSNGEELLKNESLPPDLFLLDKQLSGVNGMEICQVLKSQAITKNIPVIIVSASPDLDKQSKAAGADDYIEKPFKMQNLLSMMKKYLS
jgi:DNA-binding response OmpR family regulator